MRVKVYSIAVWCCVFKTCVKSFILNVVSTAAIVGLDNSSGKKNKRSGNVW